MGQCDFTLVVVLRRQPNSNEVTAWVNAIVAEADKLHPVPDYLPDPTLEIIDGEMFWVTRF